MRVLIAQQMPLLLLLLLLTMKVTNKIDDLQRLAQLRVVVYQAKHVHEYSLALASTLPFLKQLEAVI